MKKALFAGLVALGLIFSVTPSHAGPGVTITVRIVIGKPKKNCNGFGLCVKIISIGGKSAAQTPGDQTMATRLPNGELGLIFPDSYFDEHADQLQYFQGKTYVTFDEDYPDAVDQGVWTELGFNGPINVLKGNYRVSHDASMGGYVIVIPVD